jgi:hypothetical protein
LDGQGGRYHLFIMGNLFTSEIATIAFLNFGGRQVLNDLKIRYFAKDWTSCFEIDECASDAVSGVVRGCLGGDAVASQLLGRFPI